MADEIDALQRWYDSQCDGDWEHTYGVKIGTLDNPGWFVEIDVAETELAKRPFARIEDLGPERDWLVCEVVDERFRGHGGPAMLARILQTFLTWAGA